LFYYKKTLPLCGSSKEGTSIKTTNTICKQVENKAMLIG